MATATVHIESVGGFAGKARCFKLDPPKEFRDGVVSEYVTIWVQTSFGLHVEPEAVVIPALESGAGFHPTNTVKRQPGSFVLHDEPDTPERIDGAYWFALLSLGYDLTP